MIPSRLFHFLAASAVSAVLAFGCGSDDSADSDGSAGAPADGSSSGGRSSAGGSSSGGRSSAGGSNPGGAAAGGAAAGGPNTGGTAAVPPTLDEDGWSELEPAAGATTYYVSSSEGNDDNDGTSEDAPFETIQRGLSALEGGDWLLLKRGDVFYSTIRRWVNGPSAESKTVFGAYGPLDEPRPIIDPEGENAFSLTGAGRTPDTAEHLAVVGIHFRQTASIPGSDTWDGDPVGGDALHILRPGEDILVEDVMVEAFGSGVNFQGEDAGLLHNVVIRRSVIIDSYGQGIFMHEVAGILLEENVLDHNGWNEAVPGQGSSKFDHNVYLQATCANPVLLRNISARASSHGFQMRPGGLAEDNVLINNAIAGYISNNNILDDSVVIMRGNLAVHGRPELDDSIVGWGLQLIASASSVADVVLFENNIVVHAPEDAWKPWEIDDTYDGIVEPEGTVVYSWGEEPDEGGPFVDPDRTIPSYSESVGGDPSIEGFLAEARKLRRGYLNPDYQAEAILKYFREGFAKQ